MNNVETLARGWSNSLANLVADARSQLTIATPFISRTGAELVARNLSPFFQSEGQLHLLTDLSPSHVLDGALELDAVHDIMGSATRTGLWHVPCLHAKVYSADGSRAIITSGNLTRGGLIRNYEYGIDLRDPALVARIDSDLSDLQVFGVAIGSDHLERYSRVARAAVESFEHQQGIIDPALTAAFTEATRAAEIELIRLRLAVGPMHTVFGRTIHLILRKVRPA